MITLKTLKSVTFAVMLSLLAFFMYNFQPHENSTIEKNPKIENIQKIQNLSVNDANQFTVDRIKVEFERGTSEADKAALRLAFSQDLDIQVFHWYTCSSDPNTEIWEFIPIAQPLAIQKAQDLEDEDDIKRAVIQVSCD
jgi:hypothetical protein